MRVCVEKLPRTSIFGIVRLEISSVLLGHRLLRRRLPCCLLEVQHLQRLRLLHHVTPARSLDLVGTVAIGRSGAINAALLAASILSLSDDRIAESYDAFRTEQTRQGEANSTPKDG